MYLPQVPMLPLGRVQLQASIYLSTYLLSIYLSTVGKYLIYVRYGTFKLSNPPFIRQGCATSHIQPYLDEVLGIRHLEYLSLRVDRAHFYDRKHVTTNTASV